MQELIPIDQSNIENEQVQTVDARKLHGFLESKKQFADWIKNKIIDDDLFTEDQDYILLHQKVKQKGSGGHNRKDYALTIDTAKHLSMMERTAKGKQARQYFIECEKLARGVLPAIGSDRKEKLELELIAAKYASDILRLSDSSKLEMVHVVCERNMVSTAALPEYTEKVRTVCSATHLLKKNNCQMTTRAFNIELIREGYLEKKERLASRGKMKPYNSLTEKGLKFGQNDAFKGRPTETQAHYYEDTFMDLYRLVD